MKPTSCTAPISRDNAPLTTSSRKQRNVERYVSTIKLMMASMTVKARIRASRAPFMVPLTASVIWAFVAAAMYRGMLAAAVAACSAALQLARRSFLALATASDAESEESCNLKATKRSDKIGYASHVRDMRWGNSRYGFKVVDGVERGS